MKVTVNLQGPFAHSIEVKSIQQRLKIMIVDSGEQLNSKLKLINK